MPLKRKQISSFYVGIFLLYQLINERILAQRPSKISPSSNDPLLKIQSALEPPMYPAGTPSPIPGAPALPSVKINPQAYPPLDKVPPIDSELVKDWLKKIDLRKAPAIKPTGQDGCSNTTFNAEQIEKAGANGNCWWTCSGCTREGDVSFCPGEGTWGASFDDGPSEYTPALLDYLDKRKLKATFFVVGSRAISKPAILQAEYLASHQVCIHTWSHTSLTTLTNEQIVAELAWTMKAFRDIINVTPNCVRPPYGDYDDRIRHIFKEMGLTAYVWTTGSAGSFDSNDWKVEAGSVSASESAATFQKILSTQSTMKNGFIVLAHDLYQKSTALSINAFIPAALKIPGMKVQSIATCLGLKPSQNYLETSGQAYPSSKLMPNASLNPNSVTNGSNEGSGNEDRNDLIPPPQFQRSLVNTTKKAGTSTSNSPYSGPKTIHWNSFTFFCKVAIFLLLLELY